MKRITTRVRHGRCQQLIHGADRLTDKQLEKHIRLAWHMAVTGGAHQLRLNSPQQEMKDCTPGPEQ